MFVEKNDNGQTIMFADEGKFLRVSEMDKDMYIQLCGKPIILSYNEHDGNIPNIVEEELGGNE